MLDRRLVRLAASHRLLLSLTIGAGAAGGLLTLVQAWLLSQVIAAVFLGGQRLADVAPGLGWLLVVIGLRVLAVLVGDIAAGRVAVQVKTGLRLALFDHLVALGPLRVQAERTGELTSTVLDGVESLDAYFSQFLPQLAGAAVVPLTILLVVLPRDPLSGLVLLLTAPLIPFFMVLIGKATDSLARRQYTLLGDLSAHILDVMQGLRTLKELGQSRAQARRIERASAGYGQATMSVLRVAFLSSLVLELVATISTAIVAVEVGLRLLAGRLDFQPALFILLLAPEFYLPLRTLGLRFHAATAGVAAANRILAVLALRPEGLQPDKDHAENAMSGATRPAAHTPPTVMPNAVRHLLCQHSERRPLTPLGLTVEGTEQGSGASAPSELPEGTLRSAQGDRWRTISLRGVHVAYDGGQPALTGVSCAIEAGQTVALVGPSGAGKTTLANLLLRFVAPIGGEVKVDGQPLADIPVAAWRAGVAWVPQTSALFNASVADNIRLARPEASLAEVQAAARLAHLDDVVMALPQGYDTPIGESGGRLSGGQAQRLALARAFLKDAPLLILDEPTSQVDPDLEAQLQDATERLMRGRTVVLIAHRLSTVARADQILVLDHGHIVQRGVHADLLAQPGLYRRLVSPDA